MGNNFVEISNNAIKEIHDLNLETVENFNMSYSECFPVYISREINIDNKRYGMSIEIKLKPIKQRSKI